MSEAIIAQVKCCNADFRHLVIY